MDRIVWVTVERAKRNGRPRDGKAKLFTDQKRFTRFCRLLELRGVTYMTNVPVQKTLL